MTTGKPLFLLWLAFAVSFELFAISTVWELSRSKRRLSYTVGFATLYWNATATTFKQSSAIPKLMGNWRKPKSKESHLVFYKCIQNIKYTKGMGGKLSGKYQLYVKKWQC